MALYHGGRQERDLGGRPILSLYDIPTWREALLLTLAGLLIVLKGAAHAYHYAREGGSLRVIAHPWIKSKWLGLHETDLVFGWVLYALCFVAGCDLVRIWAMQTVAHIPFQALINMAYGWQPLDVREGTSWRVLGVEIPKVAGSRRLLKLPVAAAAFTYELWLPVVWPF